ncbi:hypothetical protein [Streptomyces roseolilacinus]|uniref:hypothetical protein n=1 Tax=Streptomyces roseolilacinus TaxID=66904 RepID=UPI00382D5460
MLGVEAADTTGGRWEVQRAAELPGGRAEQLARRREKRLRDKTPGGRWAAFHAREDRWLLALVYAMLTDQRPELLPDRSRLRAAVDTLLEPRSGAVCGLVGMEDDAIAVEYTVNDTGFHSYRAAVPCTAPACVAYERDRQWVYALHARLDAAGSRDLVDDRLERVFYEFEDSYFWAAREMDRERTERTARLRAELVRLAAARFPDLPAPAQGDRP